MLIGFLVRSREDFDEWRKAVEAGGAEGKQIVHVHEKEPRAGAVDEVETWETGEEDD
jgi:cysteine protease ATG4